MDEYSSYILVWELKRDMTADSLIDVVQQAVDITSMSKVLVKDRTSLLSDIDSGYVSLAFGDYLRLLGIKHILAAPFHLQTNVKVERYQLTLKEEKRLPYLTREGSVVDSFSGGPENNQLLNAIIDKGYKYYV